MKDSRRVKLAQRWRGHQQLRHGQRRSQLPLCRICGLPIEAGRLSEHEPCVAQQVAKRKGG